MTVLTNTLIFNLEIDTAAKAILLGVTKDQKFTYPEDPALELLICMFELKSCNFARFQSTD